MTTAMEIHHRTGVGLTVDEAHSLIGSGYSFIRHNYNQDLKHWGGGELLRVEGTDGIIKPSGRRQEERIPLANMKPWKSKNAESMQRDGVYSLGVKMQYAIVDTEKQEIWAGASNDGFTRNLDEGLRYDNLKAANQGMGALKRTKNFRHLLETEDRIEIVPLERAEAMLAKWQPKPKAEPESEPESEPKPVHVDEVPKAEPQPKAETPKTGDREIDEAMTAYRRAMSDLEEAQIMVMEARERADKAVARMGQLSTRRSEEAMTATA